MGCQTMSILMWPLIPVGLLLQKQVNHDSTWNLNVKIAIPIVLKKRKYVKILRSSFWVSDLRSGLKYCMTWFNIGIEIFNIFQNNLEQHQMPTMQLILYFKSCLKTRKFKWSSVIDASMAEESLSERQEFELQALEAIYTGDVVDLREKDAWKACFVYYNFISSMLNKLVYRMIYIKELLSKKKNN